jgi:hypothetical protein
MRQRMEPMHIQTFIPKIAIEALDIGVLRWLSLLNQLELSLCS